ncbi:hypothetical protein AG1IA_00436 [Rhizoctonia solani AG-1 IA]|uniref:Uncharacterized protein n=1 Tax=Thanatephorus cucumeris (strain AG1-IA) TaxID=983506 RepID=L8X903_THACA|nr:hypothetical protein AG1IA_00436 [Rhizoctonia solani AG-1 IA]
MGKPYGEKNARLCHINSFLATSSNLPFPGGIARTARSSKSISQNSNLSARAWFTSAPVPRLRRIYNEIWKPIFAIVGIHYLAPNRGHSFSLR